MSAILDKESIIKANAEFAKGYTDCENPCPKPTKRVAICIHLPLSRFYPVSPLAPNVLMIGAQQ